MYGTICGRKQFDNFFGEWLSGRVLAWGARDRGFDSRFPDHLYVIFFTGRSAVGSAHGSGP